MLPDRGWNTQGTVDFRGRLHRFEITLQPFYGASTASQNQLALHYHTSILFDDGQTTGLDPATTKPATRRFPELPLASNGHIPLDDEAVVHPGDGTVWVSDEYGPYVYHYSIDGKLLDVIRPPEAFIPKRKDASGALRRQFLGRQPADRRDLQPRSRQSCLRAPEQSGI